MTVRRKFIRTQAEALLKRFEVAELPVPVEKIATGLGAVVQRVPADDDLSGFILQQPGRDAAIIGVNAGHAPTRQNFTIAHELGHFVLHDLDDVHVDRGFSVRLRSATSKEGTDVEEKEANLFAAELLMPATLLRNEVQVVDAVDQDDESKIRELAEKFGVSTQAMMFRLAYLDLIRQ